jgi:hypothetical protein
MPEISSAPARRNGRRPFTTVAPDECGRRLRLTELAACRRALESSNVTFHDVATAWFALCDPALSEEERAEVTNLFAELEDAFAKVRGGIVTAYYCRHIRVAAALTSSDVAARNPEGVVTEENTAVDRFRADGPAARPSENAARAPLFSPPRAASSAIHLEPTFGDPQDWEAKQLLFRCQELHARALEFLTPKPRKICMGKIFGVTGFSERFAQDMLTGAGGALGGRGAAVQTPGPGRSRVP